MAKSFALGIYILRRSAMFICKMLWSRFNTIVINTIFIPVIPGVVFKNDNIGIKFNYFVYTIIAKKFVGL